MSAEQAFIDRVVKEIHDRSIPIRLIYDLGAHKLEESIALSAAFPQAKVRAWEANPEQWPICFSRASGQIEFHNCGVSDQDGQMDLFVTQGAGQVSFQTPHQTEDGRLSVKHTISVAVERLGSYHEIPDLIWADIQGHEYNAFMGMGDRLKDVAIIATELYVSDRDYDLPHGFDDVDALLKEHFELVAGDPFAGVFDNYIYVNRRFV